MVVLLDLDTRIEFDSQWNNLMIKHFSVNHDMVDNFFLTDLASKNVLIIIVILTRKQTFT